MRNRYGKEYWFEMVDDTTYRFHMEEGGTKYMRFGSREGQTEMDYNDLGMFDPVGGPYVTVGSEVDGKTITRIWSSVTGIFVRVE